jgi:signal transduction histidine kinase
MAKSTKQISSAFLCNGLLSLPFYVSIGLIGIIAYIAIPGTDTNIVFPALVNEVLPMGVKGLVLAGLIAIFMSTVDSILNIGSIAIIHDVFGSLTKRVIRPDLELRLLKLASLLIAISAVIICHFFNSVMDIVFFLMVIGNAIFFPGFFWGIMGLKASKVGFWFGVIGGALTVAICTFGLSLFPLYTMLIAIMINSLAILMDCFLERPINKLSISSFWQSDNTEVKKYIRRNAFFSDSIRSQDYCTVFFVCAIAVSLFPFFFPAIQGLNSFDKTILIISTIVATSSLCMLFRELWWDYVDKMFPVIWLLLLTLALPTQSIFMMIKSNYSLVWFTDSMLVFPLMLLLTTGNAAIISFLLGLVAAVSIHSLGNQSITSEIATSFGYWALVIHITVIAICLALFRKSDQETFVVTSSTLAHEASRSFLAFENAAYYLNAYLPNIIARYRGESQTLISESALTELLTLPDQLEQAAKRSRYIVEKLSFHSLSSKAHFEAINILTCIQNAITDPSVKSKLLGIVTVTASTNFPIKGDLNQITQVFINLLENALHAIANKPTPEINITIAYDAVIVRDNGTGIHRNDLVHIFDEHFSTKSTKGLGLAFSKRVMKNHGGTISCSSIQGEFAEFRLRFPIDKKE